MELKHWLGMGWFAHDVAGKQWLGPYREKVQAERAIGIWRRPSRPTAAEQDPGYRAAMKDAGRGHQLP